jgi:hypothetical protein
MASASQLLNPSAKVSSQAAVAVPEKDDDTDTKSRIGDEYILVKKSKAIPIPIKDEKGGCTPILSPPALIRMGGPSRSMKELVRASSNKRSGLANGPKVRVTLYGSETAVNSAAGAAMGGAINFAPSTASEFSSYAALYDEVKVLGGRIRFSASDAVTTSTAPDRQWAVGYDPAYGTVPASTDSVVESTQHVRGRTSFGPFIGSAVKVIGTYETHGQHVFNFKCPTSPVFTDPAALTTNFPGGWMNCGDPSDHAGYVRYYVAAPGGSTVTSFNYALELDCEFRIRT